MVAFDTSLPWKLSWPCSKFHLSRNSDAWLAKFSFDPRKNTQHFRALILHPGVLTRKIRLGFRKHNGKRFTSLPQNCHIRYGLNPKKGRISVEWVWNQEGTDKLVNGKQHSVWFVPTGMKRLPQNLLLNFRLEFPKSDLTIYLPSGISEIFCQMVSTPVRRPGK